MSRWRARNDETTRRQPDEWMRRYEPKDVFDAEGWPDPAFDALIPEGEKRRAPTRTPTAAAV